MRLERFQLQGFAQHRELDLEFRDGAPNLIIGPNEAGKSNLMRGLLGTLYGIADPEPLVPWHGEPTMYGYLRFTSGEDTVEIERSFREERVEVWVNGTHEYSGRGYVHGRAQEDERYRTLLRDWIGFGDSDVFRRTVFVGQDLLADEKLGDFSSQIKRVITGTQETNYDTATKDLDAELDTLIKRPGKRNDREREKLQKTLAELQHRHAQAEQVQEQVVNLVNEENELQEQVRHAKSTQSRYSALLENYSQYQGLQRDEEQARKEWSDLETRLEELRDDQKRRRELEEQRDKLRIPYDPEPEQIRRLIGDIDRVRTQIEHLEKQVESDEAVRSKRNELEGRLAELDIPGNPEPHQIQQLSWQIQQIEGEIDRLRQEIEREKATATQPASTQPSSSQKSGPKGLLLGAAAIVALASIGLGIIADPILFAGLLVAAGLVAAGFVMSKPQPAEPVVEQQATQPTNRLSELEGQLAAQNENLEKLHAQRDHYLQLTGLSTLDEVHQRAEAYRDTQVELNAQPQVNDETARELAEQRGVLQRLEQRRVQLLEASAETDLDALAKRADKYQQTLALLNQTEQVDEQELRDVEERVSEARRKASLALDRKERVLGEHPELQHISAEEITTYRDEVQQAEAKQRRAEDRLREIQFQRRELGRGADNAAALQQEIDDVKAEIERVQLLADAHELAIETLQESVREFQENALDPVAENAANYFMSITDGRYNGVELDRESMVPAVSGNGLSDIGFERLSRGAKDQLYLSIRAALIDALSGERDLPMVLDDPCVHFDDERLEAAAELISELAGQRQILLFTKDEAWTRWFDPVLRLHRQNASVATGR